MTFEDEILAARWCGVVRCGVSAYSHRELSQLAAEFGLRDDPDAFRELSAAAAEELIKSVLHKDMAYGQPIMPEQQAARLTREFFAQFGADARFYSNGWPLSWTPATDATFDTGVLVIGPQRCGCLWVEDED